MGNKNKFFFYFSMFFACFLFSFLLVFLSLCFFSDFVSLLFFVMACRRRWLFCVSGAEQEHFFADFDLSTLRPRLFCQPMGNPFFNYFSQVQILKHQRFRVDVLIPRFE